ncbi:MAG: hypothetical protein H6745_22900 [Deltaproteobacteria bacterium]|nr:hypothetical protein [Deltaproteobacteria bacterium]
MVGLEALAQSWTNSHTFAHGSPVGPLLLTVVVAAAAAASFAALPWRRRGAAALVHALFVAAWAYRLATLVCEGCAASG